MEQHETGGEVGLNLRVSNLVNRVGAALEETVTTGDTSYANQLVGEASEIVEAAQLAKTLSEARTRGGTWSNGFAAGALHGLKGSMTAYLESREHIHTSSSNITGEDRACRLVGGWLATLQIGAALRLLAATEAPTSEDADEANGYLAGMEFALERSVGTFQTRLERQVLDLQGHPKLSEAEHRLSTLLFVALTEPSRFRVIDSLGEGTEAVIDYLDHADYVACVDSSTSRPLRVTPAGADEVFRLAQAAHAA